MTEEEKAKSRDAERVGVAVTFQNRIQEVLRSKLGRDTGYSD
jgi:hypothetical protein